MTNWLSSGLESIKSLLRRQAVVLAASSLNLAAVMQDWILVRVNDDVTVKVAVVVRKLFM